MSNQTWLPVLITCFGWVGCTTPSVGPASGGLSGKGVSRPLPIGGDLLLGEVAMQNIDESSVSIDQVAGSKGTLLVFTCNHCPWAKAWESRIVELGNAYQDRGIGVIAINPNDPEVYEEDSLFVMQERARETGMKFPYVVDDTSAVTRAYGATKTPEVFLFDAGRKLVYHGAVDDNANEPNAVSKTYLKDALDAVVGGQPVPVATTKALGCGIKFRNSGGSS